MTWPFTAGIARTPSSAFKRKIPLFVAQLVASCHIVPSLKLATILQYWMALMAPYRPFRTLAGHAFSKYLSNALALSGFLLRYFFATLIHAMIVASVPSLKHYTCLSVE